MSGSVNLRQFRRLHGSSGPWILVLALAWLLGLSATLGAQSYLQNVGTPTFATALPVENGFINAANGNLHLDVAFGSFPQRGGGQNVIGVRYDSAIWSSATGSWQPSNVLDSEGQPDSWGGWREFHSAFDYGAISYSTSSPRCSQDNNIEYNQYSNFVWTAPDGTTHSFPIQTTQGFTTACGTTSSVSTGDALASDATAYHMYVSSYTTIGIWAPDGSIVYPQRTDTNGNYVPRGSTPSTDTVGRSAVPRGGSSPTFTYALPNSQGTTSTYTVKTTTINVSTNFGVSGVSEYSGTITVISEIDLPDGTKYSFGYDSGTTAGHYGLLTSMTIPTGGQITYSWTLFTDSYGNKYRWISGRTTPDGSWTYTPSVATSCTSTQVDCEEQVTVVRPSGDNEVFTFALNGGSWDGTEQYYNGSISSSNLLATVNQCFNFVSITNGQCSYSVTSGSPATNITQSANTTTFNGSSTDSTTTEYTYDTYGNVTQISEWNYYSGTLPTNADRTTNISYLTGSGYSGFLVDRPTSITTKDKNGNTVAQTTYSYDQYSLTSVTGVVNHDDLDYGTGDSTRGNPTQISRWLNTNNSWLTTTNYYNTVGNLIQTTDPNGNTTMFSYADNYYNYSPSSPTSAYLTQTTLPATNGVNHITHSQYYFGSGLPAATCGQNFTSTCAYGLSAPQPDYVSMSYDSMNRLATKNAGDGGQTTISYGSSVPITNTTTTTIDSTHNLVVATVLDGLGRTSQTQTSSPQGTIYVDTAYDSTGRTHSTSNPHYSGSSPTDGTTSYSYDGLDRVTTIAEPSGGSKTRSYTTNTNSMMVRDQDEVGNLEDSFLDAFGRTSEVDLYPGSGTIKTLYTYDILNNLTKVDEAGTSGSNDRIRTFTYDSLARLTSLMNAEANAISYTYDSNSNMLTKVNGRGTTITYQYDALNRLTSRSYNDGVTPTANFVFDACPTGGCPSGVSPQYPIGRVVKAYTSSAQTFYSYDPLGRNAEQWQCTPVNCGTSFIAFTYTHNYQGGQTSISYNGNFTLSQGYDAVDRITQLTNSNSNQYNPATIVSVTQFSPIGKPTQLSYGNGLAEVRAYNNRSQPTQLRVYNPPSSDVLNQTFTWTNSGSQDNGVLTGFAASGGGTPTFNRSYTYDGMNRLATMSSPADPSGCTGLSWTYDAWNNRTNQTVTGGTCGQSSLGFNTSNQITNSGFGYDADGNATTSTTLSGADPYQFDAEDRITQFDSGLPYGANYEYDANGRRIEKITSSAQVHYFYDEDGHVVVETDQNGNWTKDYVYMGGQHVAEFSGGQTYWIHTDHLGSTRTITNYQGGVAYDNDYLPFGEQILGGNFTTHKFTGYERDFESNLDYANARFYSSDVGRFVSVDPAKGDSANPQSYNRYAYVQNNPLTLTDPTGEFPFLGGCGPTSGFDEFDLINFGIIDYGDFGGSLTGREIGCMEYISFLSVVALAHPQAPPPPPPLLLQLDSPSPSDPIPDCLDGSGRHLNYTLINTNTDQIASAYTITEHLSNGQPSTGTTAGHFYDILGNVLTIPFSWVINATQTFTVSGPGLFNSPVKISFYGKIYDHNTFSRINRGGPLPYIPVNNTVARVQRATSRCPEPAKPALFTRVGRRLLD